MKKSFKKIKRATAFFVVALAVLMTFALAIPCYAATEITEIIRPDSDGFYESLEYYDDLYGGNVVFGIYHINAEDYGYFLVDDYEYSIGNITDYDENGDEGAYRFTITDESFNYEEIEYLICNRWKVCNLEGNIPPSDEFILKVTYPKPSDKPSTLVGEMFKSFGCAVKGLTNGIKGMFNAILWNDGTATSGLSHFAKFGFVMAGLSLALGLGYVIINKIRG